MQITAIAAMSLNGFITNKDDSDVRKWTSEEDKEHYRLIRSQFNLLVVGGNTFKTMLDTLNLSDGVKVIVLTNHPEDFLGWEDKVEFSTLSPKALVNDLEKRGFERMLLIGGSFVYNTFLDEDLIDELYITIEPYVFSDGLPLFKTKIDHRFKLVKTEILNKDGTLLLRYVKPLL